MEQISEVRVEKLLDIVNDAARAVSARFVTFLSVAVYVTITIAATSDEMLVRASPVALPLLNVQIPISGVFGFYTVAPLLVVLLHWDLLLQLSMLGRKLALFQREAALVSDYERTRLRERMANFYYVQFLAGEAPSPLLHMLAGLVPWLSLVVFPLALLSWTQVRFLPFHGPEITSLHRLAVVTDALLLLGLWPQLASGREQPRWRLWPRRLGRLVSVRSLVGLLAVATPVFSLAIPTIPGDEPGSGYWFRVRNLDLHERVLTANALPAEVINALSEGTVEERERELDKVSPLNFLQGRDLRHGDFFHAVLPRLDLRSRRDDGRLVRTRLQGADLRWTQMQRVMLDEANLQRAQLEGAQMQGASLRSAELQGATLEGAKLQEAALVGAKLRDARLAGAQLAGADLSGAELEGVDLSGTKLQGANLQRAQLQGANLTGAFLQGADLSGANLERAVLRRVRLQGAVMRDVAVAGADFAGANLDLTDVMSVKREPATKESGTADPLEQARLGRCREEQAALFGHRCRSSADAEGYRDLLIAYLLELACRDAYSARGLSRQALSSPEPDRRLLARALVDHGSRDACPGVRLLPAQVKEDLERFIEESG